MIVNQNSQALYEVKPHTIILLIGPRGSGKSIFAKNVLERQLQNYTHIDNSVFWTHTVSSDQLRRTLIRDRNADKMSRKMLAVSEQAFSLLKTEIELYASYPINCPAIIVDTTGLSETFRDEIREIAHRFHYNIDAIIFDYPKLEDYLMDFPNVNITEPTSTNNQSNAEVVQKGIERLRQKTMKTMSKDKYHQIIKIKKKNFVEYEVDGFHEEFYITPTVRVEWESESAELFRKCHLDNHYNWVLIGDVHGCLNDLKSVMRLNGWVDTADGLMQPGEDCKNAFLLLGDMVDKAEQSKLAETIEFLFAMRNNEMFKMLKGNHEEMNWKWITLDDSLEINEKRLKEKTKYYNTTSLLESDFRMKSLFLTLWDENYFLPFAKLQTKSGEVDFIATHAPCSNKFLGKLSKEAIKNQYKCASRSKNLDKTIDELTPYLMTEADNNHPYHFFGHLSQPSVRRYKNKFCIDTGCIFGNALTYAFYGGDYYRTKHVAFSDSVPAIGGGYSILFDTVAETKRVSIDSLEESDRKRLDYMIRNGINFLGCTISPADKCLRTGELESFQQGLEYYRSRNIPVCIQPKYMGSRAQLYLTKDDIDACYAVSRNGYKIKNGEMNTLFQSQLEFHSEIFEQEDAKQIELDGELMPWSALGEGLINSKFKYVDTALKGEITFLKDNGFDQAFNDLLNKANAVDFGKRVTTEKKEDLKKEFGHDYDRFRIATEFSKRYKPIEDHMKAWETYHKQIELYGGDGTLEYKAFRLLKIVKNDGTIVIPDEKPATSFTRVSTDEFAYIDFAFEDADQKAEDFWNKCVAQNLEGVVIKPQLKEFKKGIAPMIKVRNPDYLTIIYGYDMYFPEKFNRLFAKKNIKRKMQLSATEYEIAEKMLREDVKSPELKQLIADFCFEVQNEKSVDPRL